MQCFEAHDRIHKFAVVTKRLNVGVELLRIVVVKVVQNDGLRGHIAECDCNQNDGHDSRKYLPYPYKCGGTEEEIGPSNADDAPRCLIRDDRVSEKCRGRIERQESQAAIAAADVANRKN